MDNLGIMEFNNFVQNNHGDPFLNIPMNDIDIGRESIPILELSTSFGRESLGILKLGCDINNTYNNDLSPNNALNQAFLLSDLKSASSLKSSNFSFNLKGTDQLSPINLADFPNSFQITNNTNILNDGFLYTSALSEKLLQQYRCRFNSLPIIDKKASQDDSMLKPVLARASEGCQINCSIVEEEGNEFNDSVFIEARHLATKFKEEGSHDGFILDETDPPELINGDLEKSSDDKGEKEKYDSEKVFQKIDKLLPIDGFQKLSKKLDSRSVELMKQQDAGITSQSPIKESTSSTEPQAQPVTLNDCHNSMNGKSDEIVDGLYNTTPESKRSYMEDPEKILQALSHILAKSDRSDKDAEKGQSLVNTLREMLSNNSKEKSKLVVDDSSKSINGTNKEQSIPNQTQEASCQNSSALGDHLKPRKSNSFSFPNKALRSKLASGIARSPSFDGSKTRTSVSSAESSVEVRNYSTENTAVNLKLKKGRPVTIRRGPMKATVPIENITKPQIKGTPTKAQVMPKPKSRISTPIRDLQLKPMAQSTPDNKTNFSSSSMELTNIRSLSSSNMQEKSNQSSPATSITSYRDSSMSKDRPHHSQLPRRNSVSEGRKSTSSDLRRNSSMKESSLMKAMNKIRQNIVTTKGPLRDCSNLSSRESFSTSGKIVTTPKRVMRTAGKENTAVC